MSREIIFRGKRVDTGEWVEGSYVHRTQFYGEDCPCDDHFILIGGEFHADYYNAQEIIPETLCEFAGLTDKNGKRIFEGDIIKSTSDLVNFRGEKSGKKVTKFYEVVVTDDNSSYTYGTREIGRTYISRTIYKENAKQFYEVVGNRFDNAELLTAERNNNENQ